MRIVYTERARRDLDGIVAFLEARNVHAALVVAATIRRRIARLSRYPLAGRAQDVAGVRKAVTDPFAYVIYYAVDGAEAVVTVLAILRPAGRDPGT